MGYHEVQQQPELHTADEYFQHIQEELRTFLLRMATAEAQLPPIKQGLPFQILLNVADPAEEGNPSASQLRIQSQVEGSGGAWIVADNTCSRPSSAQRVALRSMCVNSSISSSSGSSNHGGAQQPFRVELQVEIPA